MKKSFYKSLSIIPYQKRINDVYECHQMLENNTKIIHLTKITNYVIFTRED